MSRGWIRLFTFRCPEVRLEPSLLGVQRLDSNSHWTLLREKNSIEGRQTSGLGYLTMRVGDRGGGSVLAAKWDPEKEIAVP